MTCWGFWGSCRVLGSPCDVYSLRAAKKRNYSQARQMLHPYGLHGFPLLGKHLVKDVIANLKSPRKKSTQFLILFQQSTWNLTGVPLKGTSLTSGSIGGAAGSSKAGSFGKGGCLEVGELHRDRRRDARLQSKSSVFFGEAESCTMHLGLEKAGKVWRPGFWRLPFSVLFSKGTDMKLTVVGNFCFAF